MKNKNAVVELARFLFSVLVVGYHVQMSMNNDVADFFENGALAVEFFFIVSGYFLARSIEKTHSGGSNIISAAGHFMKNKVKGVLITHIAAIVFAIAVILVFDFAEAGVLLWKGLPSIFLAQMTIVWNNSCKSALIVPEWYLSAMLVCMLFMVVFALLLHKKMRGEWVTLVLAGIVGVVTIVSGFITKWKLPLNLIYDVRAWGEMCAGMFAFYMSKVIGRRNHNKTGKNALQIVEVLCYTAPIVLGFIPFPSSAMPVCMVVTVICIFAALSITFSNKGIQIANLLADRIFVYLGSISLAIYLFHPVLINLLRYARPRLMQWEKMLIVMSVTIAAASLFNLIVDETKELIAGYNQKRNA